MNSQGLFSVIKRFVSLLLVVVFIVQAMEVTLFSILSQLPKAEAAARVVDNSPNTTGATHTVAGSSVVFVSDTVGYKFHRFGAAPNSGMCVYRKTTDGGLTWGTQVAVDTQTDCSAISVWYDQWTPGDSGTNIHIATYDTGTDQLFYNRLDTSTDTLLLTTSTSTTAGAPVVYAVGTNVANITKATDGEIYMVADDAQGTRIVSCTTSCGVSSSWTAVGTPPQGNADSWSMLMPLAGGDVLLINRSTANVLRSSVWNGTIWSGFTTIDATAVRNTTYDVGMAATIDRTTNDIYLAYVTDNDTFTVDDHDIRTAVYSGGSWSTTTDVLTNTSGRGIHQVAIARNETTDDIYVVYTARTAIGTAGTANVYYKRSTDNMATWGTEAGPLNATPGHLYGIGINILSSNYLYTTWFDANAGSTDIFGEVVFPGLNQESLVVLDPSPNTTAAGHIRTGTGIVFIDDQIGYHFHRYGAAPNNGMCVYRKTTDGGRTWGIQVPVNTQTDCTNITVWYDQWTPGDSGTNIHIATFDTGDDDLFYNRLNTADDSLLLATATSTTPGSPAVYAAGTNYVSITKATDGEIYMVADDGQGSEVVSCSTSCELSSSWADVGTPPQGNVDSWSMLMPLLGGNVMLINRSTTNQVRSSIWNGSLWSSFDTIDASAIRNTTYDIGMAATVDRTTGDIYLVYNADNNSFTVADHDIRTRVYSSGLWSSGADIVTNDPTRALIQVAIARDENNGDIYTIFTARTTLGTAATGNVYYVRSTDDMDTWGSEQGPLNSVSGDLYGISANLMSNERIFASWFDAITTQLDVYGATAADIGPDAQLSSLGTQNPEARSNVDDFYVGGAFLLETLNARTVSTINVTESGTIHAQNNIKNVRLYYDFDTSAPYDCTSESYSGSESQFGATVAAGFSGSNGIASFSTSPASISDTQSMCIYVVFDIEAGAFDGETIEISVANPENDVLVSGGVDVFPATEVAIDGTTTITDPNITQTGYHWRLDNGSESGATSATLGAEDSPLLALQKGVPRRIRLGVANVGSTTTAPSTYELQYGIAAPTCADTTTWNMVDGGGATWELFDSSNLTDGDDTINIPVGDGGVTDGGTNFVTPNGGVRDASNITDSIALDVDDFTEFEFSVMASSSAVEGETYCFRLTRNGSALNTYTTFPRVTISADVLVQSFGTQITTADVADTNVYAGGGFSISENANSRNVNSITISELGTIDADAGISNLRLYYEFDTAAPYTCDGQTYDGGELQYGSAITDGFSGVGETAAFSDSVAISTTSALCVYVVYDVTTFAQNAQTIDIAIASPASQVVVNGGGTVGPSGQINIPGETTVQAAILTQNNYHWRNDNGNETGATSATGGTQNSPVIDFTQESNIRLRLGVTNTGIIDSAPTRFRLEYAPKISTCDMATVWTDVGATLDGWDMYDSPSLTNGQDTTNISPANGGVGDGVGVFVTPNGGVRDTESVTGSTTIPATDFVELEYSITSTDFTSYSTTYCFRVSADGQSLGAYTNYAELTTAPKRDFKIQRGSAQLSTTTTTLTAGIDYEAPASGNFAFVRITNSHYTGAGNTAATAGQNADDVTAYISDQETITTSFSISRPPAALSNTRVDWEIIEFIGNVGTDNEIRVRDVGTVSYNTTSLSETGAAVGGVTDDSKVVVFITGSSNRNTSRNFYASQVTAAWNSGTDQPVFTRGANGASAIDVSYAVVEFVGANWNVQRVEHAYTAAGVTETESITAVNSLARTFLHVQKRMGATTNVVHYGHEVWLSSIGAVSFRLETGATVAVEQTSVAWIIENVQNGVGAMNIQRSNGNTTGGTGPLTLSIVLPTALSALNNTSIMANTSGAGANTTYPRPMAGFKVTSTSTYEIWRSNTGTALTYRVELVEWPVADLSIRQNYYRFYTDNNLLTPSDPWPPGPIDLGENTSITTADEPLGTGDIVRVRMTLRTSNAAMPAGLQNFKLQYALRVSTCSAIAGGSWSDVGAAGSGAVWRGYAATGTTDGTSLSTNPPTGGDLLISIADRAGSLVHQNPSAVNPYPVDEGDNIEYDWYLQQNGANPQSTYCFRAVRSDSTPLDGYSNYPQIRTAGFTPLTKNWRWYDDVENETPVTPLANENVAPIDIANNDTLALRVSVEERRSAQGENIKFKLQFSEDVTFSNPIDVVATTTCGERSLWCYIEGAGVDNTLITTQVLSDGDGCVAGVGAGCGRHNTNPTYAPGHTHFGAVTQEYAFTIRHVAARVNAVYYFRLYDVTNDVPVNFAVGESYPSLVTEGSLLEFSLSGLPSGTTTAGVETDVSSSPSGIGFGTLALDTEYIAAHRITVSSNATEGYQLFKFARQQLETPGGSVIPPITANNAVPSSWAAACNVNATGCFGYHATDPTLKNGSTRFAASDTYAALETTPVEVMYSSIPSEDTHDIVYRIRVNEMQPAGLYETEIVYLAVPSY